jgi:hypothetical protein
MPPSQLREIVKQLTLHLLGRASKQTLRTPPAGVLEALSPFSYPYSPECVEG